VTGKTRTGVGEKNTKNPEKSLFFSRAHENKLHLKKKPENATKKCQSQGRYVRGKGL
jgi:hypothetical protein